MEKEKVTYISKKNFIFLLALGIYLLSLAIEYTELSHEYGKEIQIVRYISYGLCIIKILQEAVYRKRETLFFAVILLFAGFESMISGKRGMFFLLFFLLASYGVNLKQAFKVQIAVQGACLLTVWLLCLMGVFDNLEFYRHGAVSYSMGFNYVGFSGALFIAIEASWLFLRDKKITLAETAFFLAIWIVIFHFTDTRAVTMLGIFMTVACYLAKFWKNSIKNKLIKWLCILYYPLLTLCIWGLQYYYNLHNNISIMKKLNEGLSGRLELNKHAIETYGLKLLGDNITWITNMDNRVRNAYNYVDSTYFKVLFDFGLIIGILFLASHIYIMYYMWKNDQLAGCIIMCVFSVLAFMTPITGMNTNPLLLLAGGIFHGKTKIRQT